MNKLFFLGYRNKVRYDQDPNGPCWKCNIPVTPDKITIDLVLTNEKISDKECNVTYVYFIKQVD